MTEATSVERASRRAFAKRFPEMWKQLAGIGTPVSRIVTDADARPINIDLGDAMLYPEPAPRWVEAQLRDLQDDPDRLGFADPSHCNISDVSRTLLNELLAFLRQHELVHGLESHPRVDVGYLLVFGVGLGNHLLPLLQETSARNVILIEPVAEFLLHSLSACDWREILRVADRRHIRINLIASDTPESICAYCEHIILTHQNTFIDGSYFFQHYYCHAFKNAILLMRERFRKHHLTTGFFEDEIEMVRNCHANLRPWSTRFVEARPRREQSHPVILVGAGPSLDADMQHLQALRERAIVVSCGTSIGILLKHGIRPDLHVEIERGELVHTLLAKVRDQYGFDGITLIASTTVDPGVPGLFDRSWFFVRGGLSCWPILTPGIADLRFVDPLCCNAALSAVAALGFRTVWLFGLDLAQKEDGKHHARDSVYYDPEHKEWDDDYRKRFDRVVPANFGGEVRTGWAFDLGRHGLAASRQYYGVTLGNCSDGARIDGAQPQLASSVRLPEPRVPRRRVLEGLEATMREFAPGELLREVDLQRHIEAARAHADLIDGVVEQWIEADEGFYDLHRRLLEAIGSRLADIRGYHAMVAGSVISMLRLGAFYGTRIPDANDRREFRQHFAAIYRRQCRAMAEEAATFLASLPDGQPLMDQDLSAAAPAAG